MFKDFYFYSIYFFHDLIIRETNNGDTFSFENFRSRCILYRPSLCEMRFSIDFDYEFSRCYVEINNKILNEILFSHSDARAIKML